jgi:transcription elongation GreA/GreB family factor
MQGNPLSKEGFQKLKKELEELKKKRPRCSRPSRMRGREGDLR